MKTKESKFEFLKLVLGVFAIILLASCGAEDDAGITINESDSGLFDPNIVSEALTITTTHWINNRSIGDGSGPVTTE